MVRPTALGVAGRISRVGRAVEPAQVSDGPVEGFSIVDERGNAKYHNETFSPGLDDLKFVTLRSFEQRAGAYVTNGLVYSPDGSDYVLIPQLRVVQRIYRDFIDGKAVTRIAKDMNEERVPTKLRLKGGWNVSTISRILKDEKYTGKFVWNRTTTVKDPLSGKMKQVDRPKEEWGVQERPDMRIIGGDDWSAAQRRWTEIDGVFPSRRKGKKGFEGKQRSHVTASYPSLVGDDVRTALQYAAELAHEQLIPLRGTGT